MSSGVIFAGVGASLYSVFGACISPGFAVSSVSGFRISGLGFGGSGISSPQASGLSSTGSSGTGSTGSERELMYSVETHHLTFPVPPASVCAASTSTSTQICSSGVPLFLSLSTVACPAHTIFSWAPSLSLVITFPWSSLSRSWEPLCWVFTQNITSLNRCISSPVISAIFLCSWAAFCRRWSAKLWTVASLSR